MTTTEQFQFCPNFYPSLSEYKGYGLQNTNPRYEHFKQTHFTAGDIDQFRKYRDYSNPLTLTESCTNSTFPVEPHSIEDIENTFKYMFYKFKKGIYVKIQDNQLKVFLPFSNVEYTNEYEHLLKHNPRYESFEEMIKTMCSQTGRNFHASRINTHRCQWYANNFLVRFEFPCNEGDAGVTQMRDMLDDLLKTHTIPDCDFFVNRRDFPLLKKDRTEPYDAFFGENTPLISHAYERYCPILSMCVRDGFSDIPIPTWDDWSRVNPSKIFSKRFVDFTPTEWNEKKSIAVFRGSTTGDGTTVDTNLRLKLCSMSNDVLDAGIAEWDCRPRKVRGTDYVSIIDTRDVPFTLKEYLTPTEQAKYKYIVNVDGNVSAFRLSLELGMGSVILLVDSPHELWYHNKLKEYVHYVPVKRDLSDLYEQIEWCKNHDTECEQIAKNALAFYNEYLSKESILTYMKEVLESIHTARIPVLYNKSSYLETMLRAEKKELREYFETLPPALPHIQDNDYGSCKNFEKIVYDNLTKIENRATFLNIKTKHIDHGELRGKKILIKQSTNDHSSNERTHEGYVSIFGTNLLRKEIPNFKYTFYSDESCTVTEYIEGQTFGQWIQTSFNYREYIDILMMIGCSIKVAQERIGFVHWDLYPWNVIIQTYKQPVGITYNLGPGHVVRIVTSLVPIIIDFGKSHIVSNRIHHGFINYFDMPSFQDMYTIAITSLNDVLKNHTVNGRDLVEFVKTMFGRTFPTIRSIKEYVYIHRKFSNILQIKEEHRDRDTCSVLRLSKSFKNVEKLHIDIYKYYPYTYPETKTYFNQLDEIIGAITVSDTDTIERMFRQMKKIGTNVHTVPVFSVDLYNTLDYASFLELWKKYKTVSYNDLTDYYKFFSIHELEIMPNHRKRIIEKVMTRSNFWNLRTIAAIDTMKFIVKTMFEEDMEMYGRHPILSQFKNSKKPCNQFRVPSRSCI